MVTTRVYHALRRCIGSSDSDFGTLLVTGFWIPERAVRKILLSTRNA